MLTTALMGLLATNMPVAPTTRSVSAIPSRMARTEKLGMSTKPVTSAPSMLPKVETP